MGLDRVYDAGYQEEPVDGAIGGVGLQLVEILTRMGTSGRHREAITTRPALIEGVAQRTEHAREVTLEMTSLHGKAKKIANLLSGTSEYLHKFLAGATQLDGKERWTTLPRQIFWYFTGDRPRRGARSARWWWGNRRI